MNPTAAEALVRARHALQKIMHRVDNPDAVQFFALLFLDDIERAEAALREPRTATEKGK